MAGEKYHIIVDINNKNDPRAIMLSFINPGKRVLDAGCACGDFGVLLKSAVNATSIIGIDVEKDSLDIAKDKKVYDELIHANLDNFKFHDEIKDKKFDYIVFADVLEHLRNPVNTLKLCQRALAPQGKILVTIPNVSHSSIKSNLLVNDFTYTELGLLDSTHIHLFTFNSIAKELAMAGLVIDEARFTFANKYAWQPNNPYDALPNAVKEYIFSDIHSFVCQYVLSLSVSQAEQSDLFRYNIAKLSPPEHYFPDLIVKYKNKSLEEVRKNRSLLLEQSLFDINGKIESLQEGNKEAERKFARNFEKMKKKNYIITIVTLLNLALIFTVICLLI